jgi:hypothetical protein
MSNSTNYGVGAKVKPKTSQLTADIVKYEQGELDEQQTINLFQELVDSGLAWNLQGHYGRTAYAMIQEGLVEG